MSVEIRPMLMEDVAAAAVVHRAAFPDFFLSSLGTRFLRELYLAILADEAGIAFVAADGDRVVGVVAGSARGDFYRRTARSRWFRFGWAALGAVVRRPAIARRLLRGLYAPPETSVKGALLMSLAVDPSVQRTGVGRCLTRAFVDGARQRDATTVVMTTDRVGNAAVNAFYRAQGFTVAADYVTPDGRAMNEYILRIEETHAARGLGSTCRHAGRPAAK